LKLRAWNSKIKWEIRSFLCLESRNETSHGNKRETSILGEKDRKNIGNYKVVTGHLNNGETER
jgi:hypothetical protein